MALASALPRFSMAAASVLAVTLVPALMAVFVKGKIRSEQQNPIARFFIRAYRPVIRGTLRHPRTVLIVGFSLLFVTLLPVQRMLLGETVVPFPQIGSEFMPPLWEGDMLYMPTTLPGVSPQEAKEVLQRTDRILASFPEVERVFGKVGRAETANGTVRTANARVDRVALGDITDRNVRVSVNGGEMDGSLLGMTYLSRFEKVEIEGRRLVLTR